jgi:hypothetical protein
MSKRKRGRGAFCIRRRCSRADVNAATAGCEASSREDVFMTEGTFEIWMAACCIAESTGVCKN